MVIKNKIIYQKEIKNEADLWGKVAEKEFKKHPPDYSYYQKTFPYKIYRYPFVTKILSYIRPKSNVLELGGYNGWFSIEMARKGAYIDTHDIAQGAINIAKKYYRKCKNKEKFTGTISYHITDLNYPNFPKNTYDLVIIRNVLHHLINLEKLFYELNKSLKPNGLILIDDSLPCGKKEALITGILLFLLPTDIPYSQKLQRIFKKGQILKRTQGLVDAKGTSPFEGISGAESIEYLKSIFNINSFITYSAFIGSITAHIQLPLYIKLGFLKVLNSFDILLIKIGLLKGTSYFLLGKKLKI
ncbi:class I SAM-dependent methyltransferase [Patescibacteria group bacterium]|nr:class I SAM-dependent methyltransferase [Patescibacteria group bacterium]